MMGNGRVQGMDLLPARAVALQRDPSARGLPGMGPGMEDIDGQGLFWAYERIELPGLSIPVEGHSGGDPGLLTMMYRVAGTDRGFVIMVNGLSETNWTLLQAGRLLANLARAAQLSERASGG